MQAMQELLVFKEFKNLFNFNYDFLKFVIYTLCAFVPVLTIIIIKIVFITSELSGE